MKMFRNALLIGFGSIGKQHANYLGGISSRITVIDPKPLDEFNVNILRERYQQVSYFSSIDQLQPDFNEKDIAVVANYGPDHYKTVLDLSLIGVKNFILEKPCTDSLIELELLYTLASTMSLKIAVNQGYYYESFGEKINKISDILKIGEVQAIWISGGARCISTAGSHWVSQANQIFGNIPIEITGDATNDFINPRSEQLAFIEGVFSFTYPNRKRLGVCLTNKSSISGSFHIYWSNSIGIFDQGKLTIHTRDDQTESFLVTRYNNANKIIYNEKLFINTEKFMNIYKSFKEFSQSDFLSHLQEHLDVNKAILLALISSDLGQRLKFDEDLDILYKSKKFGIS
jgi:predicted dehydrogenase